MNHRKEEDTYSTSKVALASVSHFFQASFVGSFSERSDRRVTVRLSEEELEIWKIVLEAALTQELPESLTAQQMLTAARLALRWLMPRVCLMFVKQFDRSTHFACLDDVNAVAELHAEIKNVCSGLGHAPELEVMGRCEDYLVERFSPFELCWRQKGLMQLSPVAFELLLQSNKLQVDDEASLWEPILLWGSASPERIQWLKQYHAYGFALLKAPFLDSTFVYHAVCSTVPMSSSILNALQALHFQRSVYRNDPTKTKPSVAYYTKQGGGNHAKRVEWQYTPRQYKRKECNLQRFVVFKCRRWTDGGREEYRPVASKSYGQAAGNAEEPPIVTNGPIATDILCGGGIRAAELSLKLRLDNARGALISILEVRAADWSTLPQLQPAAAADLGSIVGCVENEQSSGAAAPETLPSSPRASKRRPSSPSALPRAPLLDTERTVSGASSAWGGIQEDSEETLGMPNLGLCAFHSSAGLLSNRVARGEDGFPTLPPHEIAKRADCNLHSGNNTSVCQIYANTERAVDLRSMFTNSLWGYDSLVHMQESCAQRSVPAPGERWYTASADVHMTEQEEGREEPQAPTGEEAYLFVVVRLSTTGLDESSLQ